MSVDLIETFRSMNEEVRERLEALGRERALIYKTLVWTGLRKAEFASLTTASAFFDAPAPFVRLRGQDEKSKEGNDLVLRDDLACDLRLWQAEKLARLQAETQAGGLPIPERLPNDEPFFVVPAGLLRIFNRRLHQLPTLPVNSRHLPATARTL